VATDADAQTVEQRIQSLKNACDNADVPFREQTERIALIIPRRNIETWLAYLRGLDVDEQQEYPKYDHQSRCQGDVEHLNNMCRQHRFRATPPP
jgi:hypothetical protein